MKEIFIAILLILFACAYNEGHYFPVAEVNHILELSLSPGKIAMKYVLWVPEGDKSVIMTVLETYYPKYRITDDVFNAYAEWAIYHYEDCLNVYLDGERIRFMPVAQPVNFASFGLVFQFEHRFTRILKGVHNFLLIDNNDTNVQKSTEEILFLPDKGIRIKKQAKARRRIEAALMFKPAGNFILPPPEAVKTITGLAAPSDDVIKYSGFIRPPAPETLTGLAE